jgi:hypothetical protein
MAETSRRLRGCLDGTSHELHTAHHEMALRAVAVQMERVTKPYSRRRRRALQRAFTWLTNYPTYADAYRNKNEKRIVTDRSIVDETAAVNTDDDLSDS